jgi:hypothetical protein
MDLSFWCIVKIVEWDIVRITKCAWWWIYYDNYLDFFDEWNIEKIIWHPMTRGRLCFLSETHTEYVREWNSLRDYFMYNSILYQQTVLERPEELQDLVIEFLECLPDNSCISE